MVTLKKINISEFDLTAQGPKLLANIIIKTKTAKKQLNFLDKKYNLHQKCYDYYCCYFFRNKPGVVDDCSESEKHVFIS